MTDVYATPGLWTAWKRAIGRGRRSVHMVDPDDRSACGAQAPQGWGDSEQAMPPRCKACQKIARDLARKMHARACDCGKS